MLTIAFGVVWDQRWTITVADCINTQLVRIMPNRHYRDYDSFETIAHKSSPEGVGDGTRQAGKYERNIAVKTGPISSRTSDFVGFANDGPTRP